MGPVREHRTHPRAGTRGFSFGKDLEIDQTIRGLLHRGLIEETGPSKEPGKPMQYATTTALLRQAGADSLSTLTQPLEVPDAS